MAFNEQEKQLILYGKANGKSQQEVEQALVRLRSGVTRATEAATASPSEAQPGFVSRVTKDVTDRGNRVADTLATPAPTLSKAVALGTKATATAFGGITDVIAEAIKSVPGGRQALDAIGGVASAGFKALTDTLSNTKFFKEAAAGLPQDNLLENSLSAAASGGEIANNILAAGGIPKTASSTGTAVSKVANATGNAIEEVGTTAGNLGSQAVSKAKATAQQPIPKTVESVLKETPATKFDEYVSAARKATENNKNPTPLEMAGQHAGTALDQIQRKLETIGSQKSAVVNSAAGRTPVGSIAVKFRQELQKTLSSKTAVEGDSKLIRDVNAEAAKLGNNPTAAQVDKFIDFVQDRIYTGQRELTVPVTDATVASLRKLTGQLNDGLKAKLPPAYRTLNEKYADLVGTRNELNLKLGKDGEKGGALMKRVFSPSDANTKQLFADVLRHTGIDLTNEATLARYVMDVMGDSRQKSMLEELKLLQTSPSPSGIAGKIVDYALEHFNSPEEIIRRARELTSPSESGVGQGATVR